MSRLTDINKCIVNYKKSYTDEEISNIIVKLGKLEDLEQELGCPLEVRLKIINGTLIFDEYGNCFKVEFVSDNIFVGYRTKSGGTSFRYRDYKKAWWLKEDKSE